MFENVNEIAVVVSAFLAVALGNIWYSTALFGKIWSRSVDQEKTDALLATGNIVRATIKSILVYTLIFFILAKFIALQNDSDSLSLASIATLLAVFLAAHILSPVIWEGKPLSYFLVHAGYSTIVLFAGLGVIAYWPW